MAKTNYNLASGNVQVGITPKLNPTIIGNTRGSTQVKPGRINPNAAVVQGTDAYVPRVVTDPVPNAVADMTNVLVTEAIKYNDRVDQMTADQAIIDYRTQARQLFYGKKGADGRFEGGYQNQQMSDAMSNFNPYNASIDKLSEQALAGQSEAVRAKMVLRVQQSRAAALERGAYHNNQQTDLYEQNVRFQEKQDILSEIEVSGPSAFTNGIVDAHLAKYDNAMDREAASKYLTTQALYMTYNDSLEAASQNTMDLTPAATAYANTVKAFEAIRPTVSEDTENSMQNWLQAKQVAAERQVKSNRLDYEKRRTAEIDRNAPENIAISLSSGNTDMFDTDIAGYRSTSKSPSAASTKIIKATKGAMALMVDQAGGVTVADKKSLSSSLYDVMIEESESLNPYEKMALEQYARVDLPKQLEARQDYEDQIILAQRDLDIAEADRKGGNVQLKGDPPPQMTDANKAKWYKQTESYTSEQDKGPVSGKTQLEAERFITIAQAKQEANIPLTNAEMGKIATYAVEHNLRPGTLAKAMKRNEQLKKPTSTKPAYMKEEGYSSTVKRIDTSGHLFAGLKPKKPGRKASEDDMLEYEIANSDYLTTVEYERSKAKIDLNSKRAKADKGGQPFDYNLWWQDYVKTNFNEGEILNKETSDWSFSGALKRIKSNTLYRITGDPDNLETMME